MSKTKTLIAYFSKTGNTRQIAEKARDSIKCDIDEIAYDSQTKKIVWSRNPADYDSVILMCPIWAFHLPKPMSLYIKEHKNAIARYRLAVTCGGMGLWGCVAGCRGALGKPPERALKIKESDIKSGSYKLDSITGW